MVNLTYRTEQIDAESFPRGRARIQTEVLGAISPKPVYSAVKRIFDLLAAVLALLILLVPMCIIAIVICIDSPGSPIFSQTRLGKDQKPFTMYKFRTMYLNAEENGAVWASHDDTRSTRVGKCLRKTRLDELPQLLNIILGEMSFVGPRPERPVFYNAFDEYIDGFRQRTLVLPGLTGYAQINGGYDLLPEEKIKYDLEYIKNRSVWFDLYCLFKTVAVVLKRQNAM